MAKKTKMRAIVRIRGAENQAVYGTGLETVRRRGLLLLLEHPPGYASTYPLNVEVQLQKDDGSYAQLELIEYFEGMTLCDTCKWARWQRDAAGRIRVELYGVCIIPFNSVAVPACMRVSMERQPIWAGRAVACNFHERETQASKP